MLENMDCVTAAVRINSIADTTIASRAGIQAEIIAKSGVCTVSAESMAPQSTVYKRIPKVAITMLYMASSGA
jgi:hypothetical protein